MLWAPKSLPLPLRPPLLCPLPPYQVLISRFSKPLPPCCPIPAVLNHYFTPPPSLRLRSWFPSIRSSTANQPPLPPQVHNHTSTPLTPPLIC